MRPHLNSLYLLLALAAPSFAAPIHGVYVSHRSSPDGNVIDTYFQFEQQADQLTGKVIYAWGERPIHQGHVEGNRISFTIEFGDAAHPRTNSWEGTIEGRELHLKSSSPRGPTEMVAVPTDPSAIAPPKKETLPALKDVPYNKLAAKPPMGWNSWNKFAGRIDDKTIREIADAMARNGMRAAGYLYVNIDDTWEGQRDAQGKIQSNKKFPDIKALAEYVHSKKLLIGIYSSPGPKTCAGYEGSYGHELQDAETYSEWGIDYLKYDWCSAGRIYEDSEMQAAYQKMGEALDRQPRPIVFSLCQYGRDDVWKWGPKVSGNLWRTTDDIRDNWDSMSAIGFSQGELAAYAAPGHWNDPDMLEVGNGGMSDDEYRTHMSLWAILAAPLLAGNDLRDMPSKTLDMLTNREVIVVDQDKLGKQGRRVSQNGDQEIWTKPLTGGDVAVALFNRGAAAAEVNVKWADYFQKKSLLVRDLWTHNYVKADSPEWSTTVPSHGVVMLRISLGPGGR